MRLQPDFGTPQNACEQAAHDWLIANCGMEGESIMRSLAALLAVAPVEGQAPQGMREAAQELIDAVTYYRHEYESHGGSHIETGRAWDRMRNASTHLRAALSAPVRDAREDKS